LFAYVALDGAPISGSESTSTVSIPESWESTLAWNVILTVTPDLFYLFDLELYHARHDFSSWHEQLFFDWHQQPLD